MAQVVILAATRTPLGSFQGSLAAVPAPRLGAAAIAGALRQAKLAPDRVTDVILGNVLQAGVGQAPARQAALFAGLPPGTRSVTVNKVCGSGLQAILEATRALQAGDARIVAAGGMENMSQAPYLLPKARSGYRLGNQEVVDSLVQDGLWDPHAQRHMGSCAEDCASKYRITREDQDAYAAESFRRANAAQAEGRTRDEITPVDGVSLDEGPGRVNYDKIPKLRPAFDPQGTITAANASSLNDGGAVVLLSTLETAAAEGLRPLARIQSFGFHAQDPTWFTTAPIAAARQALDRAGWLPSQVELWEVNEAFAVVPLVFARQMNVPRDSLNVRGGAISLGHPIGASGARIVVTLLAALRERGARRGVAAICIGGGEGLAVCLELL